MERIRAFEPIVGDLPKLLILGSMPSVKSLETQEYYGHGRNQFWRIMGDFFGFERNDPYETRKAIVSDKGIAVWDVLASCQRQGSLDKDIKFPEVNDIGAFVKSHPSLRAIVFNGGKARQVFLQTYQDKIEGIDLIALGSTSPAYTLAYEKKRDQWRIILDYLDHE